MSAQVIYCESCDSVHQGEFEKIGWDVIIYEDNKWTPESALVDLLIKCGRR